MKLQMTDIERLILANQYEILSKLEEDQGYMTLAAHLRNGHEWLYREAFNGLRPVMPDANARFVNDILDLYRKMNTANHTPPRRDGLHAGDIRFPGFDGNDPEEVQLLIFAGALAEEGLYQDLLGNRAALKASMPMTAVYRRMLAKYAEFGTPYTLNGEQLQAILDAGRED